jgi:hypothetical protein
MRLVADFQKGQDQTVEEILDGGKETEAGLSCAI